MKHAVTRSILLVLFLIPLQSFAQGTISDGAVSLDVLSFSSEGVYINTSGIGADDQVYSTGFWYRTGQDTQEYPVTSVIPDNQVYAGNLATLTYNDVGGRGLFSAEVFINIQESMGDDPGIIYSLRMTPLDGASTVDVFFYADPDMDDGSDNDSGYFNDMGGGEWGLVVSDQTCMEMFAITRVADVRGYTFADSYQAMPFANLLGLLNDTLQTDLDNSGLPFGPGDFTAAFQYSGNDTIGRTWSGVMSFFEQGDENRPPCTAYSEYVPVPGPNRIALAILAMLMLGGAWHFRGRFI